MEALHPNLPPAVKQRNAGIDLLRIVAVYYVIVLHILRQGGLMNGTAEGSCQYYVTAALFCLSRCSVNIFGMISGYVGYTEEERPIQFKKYLNLWLEVAFYNILLTLLTLWFRPEFIGENDLFWMFLPVLKGNYWYFTAYSGLFLFIPLLNTAVRHINNKTLLQLLCCFILIFSPVETISGKFLSSHGYSLIWLIILYFIGSVLKKTKLGCNLPPFAAFAGICVLVLCMFFIERKYICVSLGGILFESTMVDYYVFPLQLLCAILYILLFSKLKICPIARKLISFAAPGAFSVYIINCQKHVWYGYMENRFAHWASSSPVGIVARVLFTAAVFVSVSLVVDYVRRLLFLSFRNQKS